MTEFENRRRQWKILMDTVEDRSSLDTKIRAVNQGELQVSDDKEGMIAT